MDLDPQKHKGMVFSQCGECNSCCDGSLFTVGFVPLIDFIETAKYFPIVFQEIYGEYWPGMIYTLQSGLPCPYLERRKKRCTIYNTHRPVACRHFPFRFKAKDSADREPFVGFPFIIEIDNRCPALEIGSPGLSLLNEQGNISKLFITDIGMPERVDFVEETRDFCRKLALYGLFKKKKFKQQTESGKKITVVYQVIDKKKLNIAYEDMLNRYSPYIKAHWQSLKKPKKLIESVKY
ncbi:MAG: SapC family protein [Magnetococcales bacterium]|nr:SapC family protein [Magnetococcales bacterium]